MASRETGRLRSDAGEHSSPMNPATPSGPDPGPRFAFRRRKAPVLLTRKGVAGAAREVTWLGTHIALYPLGVVEDKVRDSVQRHTLHDLDPRQRGLMVNNVEAAGTPIIMLHGVISNRTVFAVMQRQLRRRGFGRVITINYSPLTESIRNVAHRLHDVIEDVVLETGYEQVHVIGHSMGGLIGRYYVQRMGGHQRVHTLVTLGSPHSGTAPARLVPHPISKQMRPHSEIVTEFAEPAPGCTTKFLAVWSDMDQMIVPKSNARIEHPDLDVRNYFVSHVGHTALCFDRRVVHEVCTTLALLDEQGGELPRQGAAADRNRRHAAAG